MNAAIFWKIEVAFDWVGLGNIASRSFSTIVPRNAMNNVGPAIVSVSVGMK